MASLITVDGPAKGTCFALEGHRLVLIGRDDECTFQVLDESVSRKHMQIRFDADSNRHFVNDFGSANGVMVNGRAVVENAPLNEQDVIEIGATTMVYSRKDYEDAQHAMSAVHRRGEWRKQTMQGGEEES
jgi:pSer/pThr/pTyr-binding forkhead associated (FHA) protein